jgi:hypothetical protein
MRDAVISDIQSQINWLDKYEKAQTVSADTIKQNLEDQIAGVEEWQENIVKLADMGINQGLLQYLMDMGPKGAGYIRGLVEGGADELADINQLWTDAMDLQNLATDTGNDLKRVISGFTIDFENLGYNTGAGFARGMSKAQTLVNNAASAMTRAAVDTGRNVLGIASPSKVFEWIGEMTGEGFERGIAKSLSDVTGTISADLSALTNYRPDTIDSEAVYDAIRAGAGDSSPIIYLDGRQVSRGLKGLGVSFG